MEFSGFSLKYMFNYIYVNFTLFIYVYISMFFVYLCLFIYAIDK